MRIETTTDIWMLKPSTLRTLVREALEEMNTRITDYALEQKIDVKRFQAACAVVNKSCQVLNRSME